MHYSMIKPVFKEEELLIDKGSLKTKRKFAFLLDINDRVLINRNFYVNDEVDVILDYTYTNSKRPKEKIKSYVLSDISKE
ncbi:hypothetical protein HNP87_001153 [Methanococcus maripaludis]|uniref:Uncharacterized protein n=1 Tax=Methanococcus maripaludis TaxID=39152 RepID=A0A2L1CA91_METMI|nr:hypothetical protein [Methanococcus maripaludis]AVB76249.1 hypothetical protein MMJJ_08390 [Methanococcus maripaludis]MBA2840621.1 hypothetical protein [Methanococcus maripaludis]MBA2853260.1 hypothetical protein [Methanococcus maripaludis]MBA2860322.1 hypothetical protein [Methanococcus maripaludis]MBA2864672.1 hypothetical protein [Methanococcus maripaludis]